MPTTTSPSRIRTALREPLLHFLLIGAAIYAVTGWLGPDEKAGEAANRITVTF